MRRGWAFSLAAALLLTLSLAAPIPGAASGWRLGLLRLAAEMAIAGMQAQLAPPTVAVVVLDGAPYAIEQLRRSFP